MQRFRKLLGGVDLVAVGIGTILFVISIVASIFLYRQMISELDGLVRTRLANMATLAASLTDGDTHQTLTRPEQKASAAYARVRAPYLNILRANDDLIYVYTIVRCGAKVCIVMDSELPRPGEHTVASDIMQVYEQPSKTLLTALKSGRPQVEAAPYTDEYGTFLSAYAPIYTSRHAYIGVVGIDMSYRQYKLKVAAVREALFIGLGFSALTSVLLAVLIALLRRRNAQLQSKYRSIITNISAVIFEGSMDEHYTMHFINDYISTLTGYPAADFINNARRTFISLVPEEDRATLEAGIRTQLERGDRVEFECRLIPKLADEARTRYVWVRVSGRCTAMSPSGVPRIEGYMQNITLRKATEAKVAENEKQLRTLADSVPNLLWITNTYGDTVFYNKTWLDFTGRSLDQEIDDGWLHHIHPDDKDACLQKFIDALATEQAFQCWFRLKGREGDYRWMLTVCTPRFTASGKCDGFVSAATDITDRKVFEAQLKRTNQHLELFFRHTPAAIAVFDADMRYLMVSERWKTDYHLGSSPLIGRSHYDVFPDIPERWRDLHRRCLAGEIISNPEDRFDREDGTTEWMMYELHPWYEDGAVKGMIMFTEVVTERKRLDDELRRHRDNLQAMIDEQTAVIRLESDKNVLLRKLITSANETPDLRVALESCLNEICRFTEWEVGHCYLMDESGEGLVSSGAWSNLATVVCPDLVDWIESNPLRFQDDRSVPVRVALSGETVWLTRHDRSHPSPRTQHLLEAKFNGVVAFPITVDRRIIGVFEFFAPKRIRASDDTAALLTNIGVQFGRVIERFHKEDILRHAKDLAEQSAQAKSEFLSNMSHELRTPMHAILNYAGMGRKRLPELSGEDQTAPGQGGQIQTTQAQTAQRLDKYLGNIEVAGDRLLGLLNNLLDLAKLESGKMVFHVEPADLRAIVDQTQMELDSLMKAKELSLEVVCDGSDLVIPVDRPKLMQVMVNLFSNAIKFTPDHSTLHVTLGRVVSGDAHLLRFTITDEGRGVPEGELEQIFDTFIQSSQTKSGAGGTGLGLSICKQIITAHGGRIWAENAPGQGARLCFDLPCTAVTEAPPPEAANPEAPNPDLRRQKYA